MAFTVPDILPAVIDAIEADSSLTADLPIYQGSAYAVHTRRPPPADTPKPYILAGPYVSVNDTLESLSGNRVEIEVDVMVYGDQADPSEYRKVERIARNVRGLFHRQPENLTVTSWHTIQIIVSGPTPAPADDDTLVGRMVTLTVTMQPSV